MGWSGGGVGVRHENAVRDRLGRRVGVGRSSRAAGLVREDEVQRGVVKFYGDVGGSVCSLSQGYRPGGGRHGTTRQTKGLPDVYVFFPYLRVPTTLWHETKATDYPEGDPRRIKEHRDKQRPEQVAFEMKCHAAQQMYVLGGVPEAVLAYKQLQRAR